MVIKCNVKIVTCLIQTSTNVLWIRNWRTLLYRRRADAACALTWWQYSCMHFCVKWSHCRQHECEVKWDEGTNGLWTRRLQLCPSQPSPRNVLRQRLTIISSEFYQVLIATHLPTPEGWKAELVWAPTANCSALSTASAGQYATSHCKPLLFWFPGKRRYIKCPDLWPLIATPLPLDRNISSSQSVVETSIICWSEAGVNDSAMCLSSIVNISLTVHPCRLSYVLLCCVSVVQISKIPIRRQFVILRRTSGASRLGDYRSPKSGKAIFRATLNFSDWSLQPKIIK